MKTSSARIARVSGSAAGCGSTTAVRAGSMEASSSSSVAPRTPPLTRRSSVSSLRRHSGPTLSRELDSSEKSLQPSAYRTSWRVACVSTPSESWRWGEGLNIRHCRCSGSDWKGMGFAGYRFLNLEEEVSIQENILVVGTSPRVAIPDPVGTTIVVRDTFEVENQFNGGQVGVTYERRRGRWD